MLQHVEAGNHTEDLKINILQDVEEFLTIPVKNIVYEVLTDDQIINELVYLFNNMDENPDSEKLDDSQEIPIINISIATFSLET
ncbi:29815_t:CDS:2, partial [Racocetra persica]